MGLIYRMQKELKGIKNGTIELPKFKQEEDDLED